MSIVFKKQILIYIVTLFAGIFLLSCSHDPAEEYDEGLDMETIPVQLRLGFRAQTQIVAHRGYWNTRGSAENSLTALDRAVAAGFYGCEFDVRLTRDKVPIILHDDRIQNLVVESTPWSSLQTIKLKNGETIPTLQQYLERAKDREIRLLLEVKVHKSPDDNVLLVNTVVETVARLEMQQQVEYSSFSLDICKHLIQRVPASSVTYLAGDKSPALIKELGLTGISYPYVALLNNPTWIPEAKQLGLTTNVWTVNELQLMHDFILQDIDFIITDKPATLKLMLMYP